MDIGQVTQLFLTLGGVAAGITGVVAAILNRRTAREATSLSQADQDEKRRQADLTRLYDGLWATVKALETKVEGQDRTIAELREENAQCWGDRAQLNVQLTNQRMQMDDMKRRLRQLEKPDHE